MERIIRFTGLVVLIEAATAVAIKLAHGHPFGSMSGWSGIGLLVTIVVGIGALYGIAFMIANFSFQGALKYVVPGGIVLGVLTLVAVFGVVGLGWLHRVADAFQSGGMWWPVVMFAVCCGGWFARPSKH